MEDTTKTWRAVIFTWKEVVHHKEFHSGKDDTHTYITVEHEGILLYCEQTGESKIIKHKE